MAQDFFKKHAWQPDEVDWHFLVLFEDQPQITGIAKAYEPLLQHEGLYPPIPIEWLHMTILRVGDTTDISEAEMQQVCERLEMNLASLTLPELEIGSAWSWSGSICLHVTPDEPLQKLFELVQSTTKEVVGDKVLPVGKFVPHITLAYPQDTDSDKEISQQIQSRKIEPVNARATKLSLVKQRQAPPYYQWEVTKKLKF